MAVSDKEKGIYNIIGIRPNAPVEAGEEVSGGWLSLCVVSLKLR